MIRLLLLLAALLAPVVSIAQAPEVEPVDQRWLAIFEQSYGTEGLYVVEVHPRDPAAATRLALQKLNAAAQRFKVEHPEVEISFAAVKEKGLAEDIQPATGGEFVWDPEREIFTSTLGGNHTPEAGTMFLLQGNDQVRRRLSQPDRFTRERWQKLYQDPEAPELLKREIMLREFMIENYFFREALLLESIREQAEMISEALHLYALSERKQPGDAVSLAELQQSGFLGSINQLPENIELVVTKVGEAPKAIYDGNEIAMDSKTVQALRKQRANDFLRKHRSFPPAIALAARFEEPPKAVLMLDQAIRAWPDVPGLRVERLAHEARRQNFSVWTKDLDYLLKRFPAAPVLIEIETAGEYGGISNAPQVQAQIATLLADVRPDLLTHQLWAMKSLERAGQTAAAVTIYERLVFANPAWKLVWPKPGTPPPPTN